MSSEDFFLLLVSVVLIVTVPYNVYVARDFVIAAKERPHIPFLTFSAVRSVGLAIVSLIFGVLGFHTVLFYASDGRIRLLPQPFPLILLAVGTLVISVVNLYYERIKRQRYEGEE